LIMHVASAANVDPSRVIWNRSAMIHLRSCLIPCGPFPEGIAARLRSPAIRALFAWSNQFLLRPPRCCHDDLLSVPSSTSSVNFRRPAAKLSFRDNKADNRDWDRGRHHKQSQTDIRSSAIVLARKRSKQVVAPKRNCEDNACHP
jgi:hypothetical protein